MPSGQLPTVVEQVVAAGPCVVTHLSFYNADSADSTITVRTIDARGKNFVFAEQTLRPKDTRFVIHPGVAYRLGDGERMEAVLGATPTTAPTFHVNTA